jgi:hypothetical protein
MGHDYGVQPKFLSVTPTRDNVAAPGNRLADKHARLFHGKTLDEWLMIQLWSSKYLGRAYYVCETRSHLNKLAPLADKYDIELLVRPEGMLHPLADTGGLPITYGVKKALESEWFPLIQTPFVVAPCRPPGFFDRMVEAYLNAFGNPDYARNQMWVMGGYESDLAYFTVDDEGVARQPKDIELYLNRNPKVRVSTTQHWIGFTHWWDSYWRSAAGRYDLTISPVIVNIEPWEDIHIDTQDNWDWAEYWFEKKILSQGEDCYERYRESWRTEALRNGRDRVPENG